MNRRNTILIVILAGLALTGLVLIQVHWIHNAINLRESYFRKNAGEAMSAAIHKLDRMDAARRIHRMIKPNRMMNDLFAADDTLPMFSRGNLRQDTIQSNIRITIGDQTYIYQGQDPRGRIMQDVIVEMFGANPWESFSKRIDESLLDSLLFTELKNRGIETRFEYGVYSPRIRSLLLERTGNYSEKLVSEGLSVNLSPRSVMQDAEYLLLYFPRQTSFLLQQMSGLLLGSILFILIIALSFYYTASTIFRQKKLSEMKNDFINNMTHEFKTPISTVALACEALSDHSVPKTDKDLDEYVDIIRQENDRLGGMAEKVLQTAIIDKGELHLKYEEIPFHDIVNDALRQVQLQVSHHDGRISWEAGADTDLVKGDRIHLTNLISNLLDNAIKYSDEKPEIVVSTKNSEGGLLCSVTDHGVGISRLEQRRIFDKLYRVHTGNLHDVKGFGLGLNYVKAIVEQHGGWVSVQSEQGQGSTFSVWLPQQQD